MDVIVREIHLLFLKMLFLYINLPSWIKLITMISRKILFFVMIENCVEDILQLMYVHEDSICLLIDMIKY